MNTETIRQDRSWVWLLTLYTIASFVEAVLYGQFGAFTPLYLPQLGIPVSQVPRWTGIIASAAGIPGLLFLPFWGALADRYARKPIIVRSYIVHFLAGVICAASGNIWIFLVGRALSGLALGNSGLMMTTLAERTPSNRNAMAFAIMNSATPFGLFIGPLIGGPVVDHFGFPVLLLADAGLMLLVILSLSLGYQDHFQGTDRGPILKMALDSVRIVFTSGRLQMLFPALFTLFAGWVLAITYVPLAISQLYRGSNPATMVGIVMGAGGFLTLFLGPLLGGLADRFGHWRVLIFGAVVEALLWPLLSLFRGLIPFGISYALVNGLASGVFAISFSVLAASASKDVRGRVMSFAYLPVNIGSFLGPFIGAVITQGSVFNAFPAAAVFTASSILLLVLAQRRPVPD